MILGTAAYMAPEQARGRAVDKRADVWAFAVVLYEMLTGRVAFAGEDVSDILASVLKFEPDWSRLPPDTPPSIRRLLKRCLTKDPKLRLRECGSALADIHEALADPDRSDLPTPSIDVKPVASRRQWVLIAAAALVLGAVLGAIGWTTFRSGASNSAPQTTRRLTIALPEGDIAARGMNLAISPDGRTLVYRARRGTADHFFRRAIDQFDAAIIPDTEAATYPSYSNDGAWLAFIEVSGTGRTIKKIPVSGGPAQTLATSRLAIGHTSWTKHGGILWRSPDGIMSVPADGGESALLFKADGKFSIFHPQLLADNTLLMTTLPFGRQPGVGEIVAVKLAGERKTVQTDAWAGRVLPSGHLVFIRSGALWAVPFDADRLEAVGSPIPVVQGVNVEFGGNVQFAVADDGTLAYLPETATEDDRPLAFVGRDGGHSKLLKVPARDYLNVALSPDQTRVAAQIGEEDDADVWVAEIGRGTLTQVTKDPGFDGYPRWSQDGRNIVFASRRDGRWTLQRRAADGSGDATPIIAFDASVTSAAPYGWLPDGSTLLFGANRGTGVTSADSKGDWKPLMQSARDTAMSPNGRLIAYTLTESGSEVLYVQGYPIAGERRVISTAELRNNSPRWSRDSGELFYLRGGPPNAVMRVTVQSRRDGDMDIGTPEVFVPFNFCIRGPGPTGRPIPYDVTPDGKRLLVIARNSGLETRPVTHINVVLNWLEELKQRIPTR